MKIYCKDCIYWIKEMKHPMFSYNEIPTGQGFCHRKPPLIVSITFPEGIWPKTKESDWCGEGKEYKITSKKPKEDAPPPPSPPPARVINEDKKTSYNHRKPSFKVNNL